MTARAPLAEMLLAHGLVEADELDLSVDLAEAQERALLAVLVERNAVDDVLAARMLSSELNLYRVDLDQRVIDKSVLHEVDGRLAHHFRVVPVGLKRTKELDHLYVAVSDPTGPALAELQSHLEKQVVPLVATEGALTRVLGRCYPGHFEPIRSSPQPVDMPSFSDVVVGNIIDDAAPRDRGGSEWLTASTQEVREISSPTLNVPPPKSPSSLARDDDWLRERLAAAQGQAEAQRMAGPPDSDPAMPSPTARPPSTLELLTPIESSDADRARSPAPVSGVGAAEASFAVEAPAHQAPQDRPTDPSPPERQTLDLYGAPQGDAAATHLQRARLALELGSDSNTAEHPVNASESPPTLDDEAAPFSPNIASSNQLLELKPSPAPAPARTPLAPAADAPSAMPSAALQTLEPLNLETLPLGDEEAQKAASLDDGPPEDGVTFVCEDQNIRLQLRTALADVLDGLYDHTHLSDASAIVESGTIRRLVLLYPRADGALVSALRKFRSLDPPPSVLVISRNRAFEVMRGVDVRIDPPSELSRLPEAVFDALSRLGLR